MGMVSRSTADRFYWTGWHGSCTYEGSPGNTAGAATEVHRMKLAKKTPTTVSTVVSTSKNTASVWYSKPVNLGQIDYEDGYWYTRDRMRFMSSRDALQYLVRVHELGGVIHLPPLATVPAPVQKRSTSSAVPAATTPIRTTVRDQFVQEILDYLRGHPEVRELLDREQRSKQKGKRTGANVSLPVQEV